MTQETNFVTFEFVINSSIASMPSYSMSGANGLTGQSSACLQQQANSYSCMLPPPGSGRHYDLTSLGSYGRSAAGCTPGSTPHSALNSHLTNGSNAFGSSNTSSSSSHHHHHHSSSTGLISPGVSVPVQVPGNSAAELSGQHYWPRVQCN